MKQPAQNGDENDCFYARQYYNYFRKAGRAKKIKQRFNRRQRRTKPTNETENEN